MTIAERLVGALPPPRLALLRTFRDEVGETIDRGLVLYFPQSNSYTGEEVVEFHGHGGTAVVAALLRALVAGGARLAARGEFTERAFLNGQLDLSQAEAVAALIEAESDEARRAALRSLEGHFGEHVRALSERIVAVRVQLEAALDFPDEEEPVEQISSLLLPSLERIRIDLETVIRRAQSGYRVATGTRMVLLGAPNVGKSSLLNALSDRDAAIVSATAGTTRDLLRETVRLAGRDIELIDTAGLRCNTDAEEVELEGMRRARLAAEQADVLIVVVAGDEPLTQTETDWLDAHLPRPAVVVRTKIDLLEIPPVIWEEERHGDFYSVVPVSSVTGAGISDLRLRLNLLAEGDSENAAWSAREWHLEALQSAHKHLDDAIAVLTTDMGEEFAAESLRSVQRQLGILTGEITSSDLLGQIFSRFCIGK